MEDLIKQLKEEVEERTKELHRKLDERAKHQFQAESLTIDIDSAEALIDKKIKILDEITT